MADSRRAEIARKKAQIEQMRKERKEKELGKAAPKKELSTASSVSSDTSGSTDPDALFRDLGIPIKDEPASPAKSPATVQQAPSGDAVIAHPSPRRHKVQLSIVKVNETNIPPRENVAYSKETQTANLEPLDKDGRRKRSQGSMSKGPWDYYGIPTPAPVDRKSLSIKKSSSFLEPQANVFLGPVLAHSHLDWPQRANRVMVLDCIASTQKTGDARINHTLNWPPRRLTLADTWDYRTDSAGSSPRRGLMVVAGYHGSPKFVHPNLEWDDEFYDDLEEDDDADTDSLDVSADGAAGRHHGHQRGGMPHVEMVPPTPDNKKKEEAPTVRDLSEEEKQQIMMSEDYQGSVMRASRVIQRLLTTTEPSVAIDYSGGDKGDKDDDLLAGEKLKLQQEFFDERWSKRRTITSMDWSTQHPELLLASYNANEDAPNDPDGVALIWNLKYKNMAPEYIFHCQSSVLSTCFAKFNPNVVIGGTYSGRIVLWDNRVNKRTPVQRTPLSASSHTHPVYCVNVVGTQNAHNLISVSTDGKVCSWSLEMMSQPQDSMELQAKQSRPVAATCFSFLSGDANNFIVGTEECAVYSACRHGSKAGINEAYEGHQGPITSINTHKVPGQIDFSPYFLTSSFDWTVKLWSIKQPYYIHSFEDNSDYVYDVQWSPIHPALFASVDGEGRMDVWNLNSETEVPTASYTIDGRPALNQCRWHQTGHQIGVGDNNGRIHVFDVGEHIANPKNDEWSQFVHTLQELKQNAAEREEDSTLSSGNVPQR